MLDHGDMNKKRLEVKKRPDRGPANDAAKTIEPAKVEPAKGEPEK